MRGIVKYSAVAVLSVALSVGLTGCGNPLAKKSDDAEVALTGDALFDAGLQYVRVVDRDAAGVANDQPVAIGTDEMRTVLESIYVQEKTLIKERQTPLFSPGEIQILGSTLSSGLAKADNSQDVIFVMVGSHQGMIAKERMTNSARVFMSGGRLNMVFGKVHELYRERDPISNQEIDRRLHPLLPGTRKSESELTVPLVLDKGQSFYIDPETGKERKDWLVIDVATVMAVAAERQGEQQSGQLSPEMLEDIARTKQETNNLRGDMANIKEVLFEMSDKLDRLSKELEELKSKQ